MERFDLDEEGKGTHSTKESGIPEGPAITYMYRPRDERDGSKKRGKMRAEFRTPKRPEENK